MRRVELLQEMVQEMVQQESNRQQSGIRSPAVLASLQATRAVLSEEMAKLRRQIQKHVEQSAELKAQQQVLCSIPGVGRWTAVRVLAEIERDRGGAHRGRCPATGGLCRPDAT